MSIQSLLNQSITIYNRATSFDRYGNAIFTTGAVYDARVQRVYNEQFQIGNEQVNIDLVIFIGPDITVNNDDKIVYGGVAYKVIAKRDEIGRFGQVHHIELKVTQWAL